MTDARCKLGEGLFVAENGDYWWVDILEKRLFHRAAEHCIAYDIPEIASKVLRVDEDGVLMLSENGVATFRPDLGSFSILGARPPELHTSPYRANDGVVLADGSIFYGRMLCRPQAGTGDLVHWTEDSCCVIEHGIAIPNTFVPLCDGVSFLVSDSMEGMVYRYHIDFELNAVVEKEVWCDFAGFRGTPDGGCVGANGQIYIAMWGGACVVEMNQQAELLRRIEVDALQPTSLSIAKSGQSLIVTSATEQMNEEQLANFPSSGLTIEVSLS